jgi:hypothetical protein
LKAARVELDLATWACDPTNRAIKKDRRRFWAAKHLLMFE